MSRLPDHLSKLPALSIRPLWAYSIVNLGKTVENRSWNTNFRGAFLIHASLGGGSRKVREAEDELFGHCAITRGGVPRLSEEQKAIVNRIRYGSKDPGLVGGIVGVAELFAVVHESEGHLYPGADSPLRSPWFIGPYGFVLRNIRPLDFIPCPGRLGFFRPQIESV